MSDGTDDPPPAPRSPQDGLTSLPWVAGAMLAATALAVILGAPVWVLWFLIGAAWGGYVAEGVRWLLAVYVACAAERRVGRITNP